MKAVIWTAYGSADGLQIQEVTKPEPKENEVCIRVIATSVLTGDCEMRSLSLSFALSLAIRIMNGLLKPKRRTLLGQEFAGIIETVGSRVSGYKKGDKVFGATGFGHGTYAEYICLPADSKDDVFIDKPNNLTYEESAVIPVGALEALYFLDKAELKSGEKIIINGAGGSIGTMAVQIAKHLAASVTAVDHADKTDMLLSVGADTVLDYTKQDFTQRDEKYDVIFDIIGKAPYGGCVRALNAKGRYLIANPTFTKLLRSFGTKLTSDKKVIITAAERNKSDLIQIKELLEADKIRPVIDQCFSLEQMPDAHRYVDTGQKKGAVAIKVGE